MDHLGFLRLLQLADSAVPIGGASHSFGLETFAEEGLAVSDLYRLLESHLEESGVLDATYCRAAHAAQSLAQRISLNSEYAAWRPAREARLASATLGRRLTALAGDLTQDETLVPPQGIAFHLPIAFGAVARALEIDALTASAACLHQSLTGLISAAQRLLPLGQSEAAGLLWDLKPAILQAVQRSSEFPAELRCCALNWEIASMRHPLLVTRLFIS